MKTLSVSQTFSWLDQHGYSRTGTDESASALSKVYWTNHIFNFPALDYGLYFAVQDARPNPLAICEQLIKWFKGECLFIFEDTCPDWGVSNVRFSGALEEYIFQVCPDHNSQEERRTILWESYNPQSVSRIVEIMHECLDRNWEAYVLSDFGRPYVELADEVIEVHTNERTEYEQVRSMLEEYKERNVKD